MLIAIDGIPCTIDELTHPRVPPEDALLLPICQGTKTSLIHIVEALLSQLRQIKMFRWNDRRRILALYWSQMPFVPTSFETRYIRRHLLSMEAMLGPLPLRRVLVEVDKDYAFEKLAQQNVLASTHELREHIRLLKSLFHYDLIVRVPAHEFETQSLRNKVFLRILDR